MKDRRESKRKSVVYPDYNTRIREYNREKQEALLLADTPTEAERIIKTLRKRWNV